jgi:photosystem II stability/assembly factor-like uncharacterized protein
MRTDAIRRNLLLPIAVAALAGAAPARAAGPPPARAVEDLSRGFRFSPPNLSFAEAPSTPDVMYVGTRWGRVYVTRDAGRSWEESSVLTPRGSFYGVLRPWDGEDSVAGVGVADAPGLQTVGELVDFSPDAELQDDNFDYTGGRPSAFRSLKLGVLSDAVVGGGSGGGGGGGGGGSSLGVGLRNTAPWLQLRVREKRGWGVGISIKQTLALKAANWTEINYIDVDPRDPNVVLAATAEGIVRSFDGGYSWPLVLTGSTKYERWMNQVARDPRDPATVYAASWQGLHVSRDGGLSWDKLIDPLVAQSDVTWITFHPTQPKTLYVGVGWGLLKSVDGGKSFDLVYRSPWPAASLVRRVVVDPARPTRVFVATADGLMVSEDDGGTFERAGGLLFTGSDLGVLSAGKAPGHFIAGDRYDLWETRDGGKSWQALLFGRIEWDVRAARFSRHAKDTVLIVTSAEMLRLAPATPRALGQDIVDAFRELRAKEPSVNEAVSAALGRFGADVTERLAYRAGARWRHLLPTVRAGLIVRDLGLNAFVIDRGVDDELELRRLSDRHDTGAAVFATWDLVRLLRDSSEVAVGRVADVNRSLEYNVRQTVINLYQERRRLQLEAMAETFGDTRTTLMRDLRLEELTAHLNALTGDLFAPYRAL